MEEMYLAAVCAVVPGLGRRRLPALIGYFGSAEALYKASAAELQASGLCTARQAAAFAAGRSPGLPESIAGYCRRSGVRLLTWDCAAYPAALRMTADPPPVLYVRGCLPCGDYAAAVVGSRSASPYGLRAAAHYAAALAAEGVPVVSGGARGVDTAAHEACLRARGETVAVLGCGPDTVYPAENRELFARISGQGAVITEYAPGMPPLAVNFPARNRIIAGLCQAVIVAEAARRSGAIITANIAADEGRDVYCVPGNVFDGASAGCHDLIRTGARLTDSPGDILQDMLNWRLVRKTPQQMNIFDADTASGTAEETAAAKPGGAPAKQLSPLGEKLWAILGGGARPLETLVEQSGADLTAVSMELLELQVAGLVDEDRARRYYRI